MSVTQLKGGAMGWVIRALTWVSVAVVLRAFFLPWATIDLEEPGLVQQARETLEGHGLLEGLTKRIGTVAVEIRRGAETVTGELPSLSDIPRQVSGAQIPQLANQDNAQVAIALLELLANERQHIGAKSYAVYLVPSLALLCGLLLTVLGGTAAVALGVAGLCAGIAGVGFWKLLTTNTQTLFIAITIGPGLWLSLWAYVGLAVSALLFAAKGRRPLAH